MPNDASSDKPNALNSPPKPRHPPRKKRLPPSTKSLILSSWRGWFNAIVISLLPIVLLLASLLWAQSWANPRCENLYNVRVPINLDSAYMYAHGILSGKFHASSIPKAHSSVQVALQSLPPELKILGDLIKIEPCDGAIENISMRIRLPYQAMGESSIDTYGWYDDKKEWRWLANKRDISTGEMVLHAKYAPSLLALVNTSAPTPTLTVEMPLVHDESLLPLFHVARNQADTFLVPGVYLSESGMVSVRQHQLLSSAATVPRDKALLAVRNWGENGEVNRTLLRAMLTNETHTNAHIAALLYMAVSHGFAGIHIDYRGLDETLKESFTAFIQALDKHLAAHGKILSVSIPTQISDDGHAESSIDGFDLYEIGQFAEMLHIDLTTSPEIWEAKRLSAIIEQVQKFVARGKLRVLISPLSIQKDANNRVKMIGLSDALAKLEGVRMITAANMALGMVKPVWGNNDNLLFARYDAETRLYTYAYVDERGFEQTIWINTAESLSHLIESLGQHDISVTIRGLFHPDKDNDAGLLLRELAGGRSPSDASIPSIRLEIGNKTAAMIPISQIGDEIRLPAALEPGKHIIAAAFQSRREITLPTSQIVIPPDAVNTSNHSEAALHMKNVPVESASPFSNTGGIKFELGGYVNDISHAPSMKGAGMTWARTIVYHETVPDAFIAAAKARGFKVIVTAIGDPNYIMEPWYRDRWTQYLGDLAAAGADAIEVWSEPNYRINWPVGRISGKSYADLLNRAYFAIKARNPETLVISAGLAQTLGAYGGGCADDGCDEFAFLNQMASEGAQYYMDCVGIYYTHGSDSPNKDEISPYFPNFKRLHELYHNIFNGHVPLCFTALGYLTAQDLPHTLPLKYAFAKKTTINDQTEWLAESVRLSKQSGKVRLLIIWNVDSTTWVTDDLVNKVEGDPQAGYAIIRQDGTCPACAALRQAMLGN